MRSSTAHCLRMIVGSALCGLMGAHARAADAPVQPDWVITADGGCVVHLGAGMAWPRCVEGMRWHGRACEGQPVRLDFAAAQALARSRQQTTGVTSENMARLQFMHGWVVNTTTGEARNDALERSQLLVRLVRPLD